MSTIEKWNRRAGHLLRVLEQHPDRECQEPTPLDHARATMARWRALVAQVPHLALRAAAHHGLEPGPVQVAVERLRRGCLTLAGTTGGGKTVGAAWLAYHGRGSVLWLDAVAVGQAEPAQIARWRSEIPGAGLVVIDDIGAGSSSGDWASRKVADLTGAILERSGPSVACMNLDRRGFVALMDGAAKKGRPDGLNGGRMSSRLSMAPNVWVDIKVRDRRPTAVEPPEIDVLPPREAAAQQLLQSRAMLVAAHRAYCMADVEVPVLTATAKALGFGRWSEVDQAIAEAERQRREIDREIAALGQQMRVVVPAANDEPEPPPQEERVAAELRRLSVLDLVANVAERRGVEESEVLRELGRTRRTVVAGDEQRLRAWLTGEDIGPAGDVAL